MQLLVSVRHAPEVSAALAGGAEIIDAKDPARGPLGAVEPAVLAEVAGLVPVGVPLSVALGDARTDEDADHRLAELRLPAGGGPRYVKLGFAGFERAAQLHRTVAVAAQRASELEGSPQLIAVAYADYACAAAPPPPVVARAAAEAGAAGVLLDTWTKDGRDLFDWISITQLTAWVEAARQAGLLVGVAGSLGASSVERVAQAAPHVFGVRGAACQGGRAGAISAAKVAQLRTALEAARR